MSRIASLEPLGSATAGVAVNERFIRCANCLGVAAERKYRYGCCRGHGRHQDCRYCPVCGVSIDFYGFSWVGPGEAA